MHWDVLAAANFFTVEVWGLVKYSLGIQVVRLPYRSPKLNTGWPRRINRRPNPWSAEKRGSTRIRTYLLLNLSHNVPFPRILHDKEG